MPLGFAIDNGRLAELCRRYHVIRLELFGSRAKGTARPDSDVDLLVSFEPEHIPSLLSPNGFMALIRDLEALIGRKVDVLTRALVESDENEYFRSSALAGTETLYAA